MKCLCVGVLFSIIIGISMAEKKVVCYHGTWSTYRFGEGKFGVSDINPNLCTHLIYAFFGVEENGNLRIIDPYLDLEENWGRGNIKKFNDLKKINPNLKTLAAVGGWNEGSLKFSLVAKDPAKRKIFVKSAVEFLLKHGFDGLDLDWEYPSQRGGDQKIDKENYTLLLKELKPELQKHNLLLSAAVASTRTSAGKSYNIAEISKYLDFINVMTYDLNGSWDNTTGINSPLHAGPVDTSETRKELNVDSCISYWLSEGAPSEKIILGIPLYGRTFTLTDSSRSDVGAPANGPGLPGRYTNEPGMIGYNELCEKYKTEAWTIKWESEQKVPYAHRDNQWIGYDDVNSVALKVQYALNRNLGGVMVWSVETDDFRGICGEAYPLLKKINKEIGKIIPSETTSSPSTSTEPPTPGTPTSPSSTSTTQSPSSSGTPPTSEVSTSTTTPGPGVSNPKECKVDGIFQSEEDCSEFYICSSGKRYDFKCPGNLLFDETIKSCNYPHLVEC